MSTHPMFKMFTLSVLLLLITALPLHAGPQTADTTLSPYFYVESAGDGEGGTEAFPLLDTQVNARISGVIAHVTVKQRYANRGSVPIHARYIFPGSTRAAVHGLTLTIGDRVIRAQIKERETARAVYEAARKEGKSASLLEQERPNVFSMAVANILPGDLIDVEMEYTELLVPENGTYEFVYPTVVGPRYTSPSEDQSNAKWVSNPYLKTGSDPKTTFNIRTHLSAGMTVKEVSCSSHPVKIDYDAPDKVRIDLDTTEFSGNRDYILRYRLADREIATGLLLFEGKDENFFLLMAQPPQRPTVDQIPGREYLFVVDVSGSMHGFPLNTAKVLVQNLIGALRPTDQFNILFFSGGSQIMAPSSVAATAENIQGAIRMLDNQRGGGGTELLPALRKAMTLPASEGYSRNILVITDGYVSAEKEAFTLIRENLNTSNVFAFGIGGSVNRYLIEGLAKAGQGEPFVVTDPSEAAGVANRFREYVSTPVLTHITASCENFETYDVEPARIPDLFAKRPVLVLGKWRGGRTGKITLSGTSGAGVWQQSFFPENVQPGTENAALRYLWARQRVAQLSDYSGRDDAEQKAAIVNLGLTYNLLTAHTSFVAVDEMVRNPGGDGKEVKQPLPLPTGVSERAVGSTRSVPEPEFWILGIAALIILTGSVVRRRYRRG
ncbi:VWA domain-containing protein [Desulfosarcina sp. OttesenSCG-928-G10]|nr:VWA domain-containing protein [Desulfosarcina sp. OttesenSCG-928-G10]MDL2321292.1 VWA domain-containing protein [Desulfosarcina sp. OttesenSCG-928-B08]